MPKAYVETDDYPKDEKFCWGQFFRFGVGAEAKYRDVSRWSLFSRCAGVLKNSIRSGIAPGVETS